MGEGKFLGTTVSITLTVSVYPAQFPRSIATYLKGAPDPGVRSIVTQTKPSKVKQSKHTKQLNNELTLR